MPTFTKTAWTKIKYGFGSPPNQPPSYIHSTSPDLPDPSKTYNFNKDTSIEMNQSDHTFPLKESLSLKPHCPVFTVAIGMLDIFMLIVVYIVQEGTVLTADTWIKMGCKYVPCMKPLYSKAEQEIYNTGLKSQCQSFLFPYQFFRFFTPIFLHGGITHLLSNLVYQALAGSLLEGKYDIKTLGVCYILFGCSGNVMSALCNPKSISVGASGAVYGLLFFCIIDNTLRIFTNTINHEKIIQFLITFLVIPYFILSILFDVDISGHTDHAAHIGGAVMGILVAIYLCEMPGFITARVPNGELGIKIIALILIFGYFTITLLIFYLHTPVNLK